MCNFTVCLYFLCISCLFICEILSTCPRLTSNLNIVALCLLKASNIPALECNKINTTDIPVGTTVTYKCEKHFKPITKNLHSEGWLNCTEDGTWSNIKEFQNFYCVFDCGKRAPKNELISQGNSTEPINWPWVATIFRRSKQGDFKYTCGGTLIGQKTLITAAHCVTGHRGKMLPLTFFKVFVGTISSKFDVNLKDGVQMFLVNEIHVHQDYVVRTLSDDIAIVLLNGTVRLSYSALPVCLPRSYNHDSLVLSYKNTGELGSFGIDGTGLPANILQHAYAPVTSSETCEYALGIVPEGKQFCGGNITGPNICREDSGAGLVFKSREWNEERYTIHGIVSNTGEVTQGCRPIAIFTKVFSYISWIEEKFIAAENFRYFGITGGDSKERLRPVSSKLYTSAEKIALSELRPLVNDILLEDHMHRDEYLIRFLRTKKLNLAETKKMLKATMEWRKANRINEILNEDFTQMRQEFPSFVDGFDKKGRPIYISLLALWDYKKYISNPNYERYLFYSLEEPERRVRAIGKPNITQAILIADLYGFARDKHLCFNCLNVAATWQRVFESYYPQLFYSIFTINVPPTGDRFLEILQPLVSQDTARIKRVFGRNKTEYSVELLKLIAPDQLYVAYGGTRTIREGTKRLQLAL